MTADSLNTRWHIFFDRASLLKYIIWNLEKYLRTSQFDHWEWSFVYQLPAKARMLTPSNPISQTDYEPIIQILCNAFCSHFDNNHAIRPQFCSCHGSIAAMTYAKLWPDWMFHMKIMAKNIVTTLDYEFTNCLCNEFPGSLPVPSLSSQVFRLLPSAPNKAPLP